MPEQDLNERDSGSHAKRPNENHSQGPVESAQVAPAAWYDVASHGLPPCDGETVYLGENSNGYLCTFTWVNPTGLCVQGSPEAVTAQFSELKWWRLADRPNRAALAAEPVKPQEPVAPADVVQKALRRAFSLGQTYWQQADSDSDKQNAKSGETLQKFEALVTETCAASPAPAAPDVVKDAQPLSDEQIRRIHGLRDQWPEIVRFARAIERALMCGYLLPDHAMDCVKPQEKQGEPPVAWWNGISKSDGASYPSYSQTENTWHDIPLYAGVNPCNFAATQADPVPGMVLVPVEPTPEMCAEAMEILLGQGDIYSRDGQIVIESITPKDLWRSMLRAAPKSAPVKPEAVPATPVVDALLNRALQMTREIEGGIYSPRCEDLREVIRDLAALSTQEAAPNTQEVQEDLAGALRLPPDAASKSGSGSETCA